MRKLALLLACVLLISLWGCSGAPGETTLPHDPSRDVEILKNWSFQYNDATDDYSIFFALLDEAEQYIAAEVDVDVHIVNENGVEVYRGTHTVTQADFGYYSNQVDGEQYLANLKIPASAVAPGTAASGTVYFTVYKSDYLDFGEVNCEAFYCLPLLDAAVAVEELPVELDVKDWDGSVASRIRVDEVTYLHEKELRSTLRITVSGTKTYGTGNLSYDIISYKLYDSEGYVVESGDLFLDGLSEGDRFKDDSIVIYDAIPGEVYTIVFTESAW